MQVNCKSQYTSLSKKYLIKKACEFNQWWCYWLNFIKHKYCCPDLYITVNVLY